MTRPVILFDVNETLLDLAALDPHFARAFGDAGARRVWFGQLLQLFLTVTVVDAYRPFDELADAALTMLAESRGATLAESDRVAIRAAMGTLPPHADAAPALDRLRAAGYRVAALTNSTERAARAHLEHAGLAPRFEAILSADAVRRYKPAREAYAHAARALGVALPDIRLVAAHGWDVAGARRAGCRAAFVARPGQALDPGSPRPEIVEETLTQVAERIVALDRGS